MAISRHFKVLTDTIGEPKTCNLTLLNINILSTYLIKQNFTKHTFQDRNNQSIAYSIKRCFQIKPNKITYNYKKDKGIDIIRSEIRSKIVPKMYI